MRAAPAILAVVLSLLAPPAEADKVLWDQMVNQCTGLARLCTRPSPVPTSFRTPQPSVTPTATVSPGFPTQTPGPNQSATPVPFPTFPPLIDDTCADGFLDRVLLSDSEGDLYGVTNVRIVSGARKRYCAHVAPPIIPSADFSPGRLLFEWLDLSGTECGALNMLVEPLADLSRTRGTAGFAASGNIQYTRRNGAQDNPAQTAPGVYSITLSGGAETCVLYRIGWRWLP